MDCRPRGIRGLVTSEPIHIDFTQGGARLSPKGHGEAVFSRPCLSLLFLIAISHAACSPYNSALAIVLRCRMA